MSRFPDGISTTSLHTLPCFIGSSTCLSPRTPFSQIFLPLFFQAPAQWCRPFNTIYESIYILTSGHLSVYTSQWLVWENCSNSIHWEDFPSLLLFKAIPELTCRAIGICFSFVSTCWAEPSVNHAQPFSSSISLSRVTPRQPWVWSEQVACSMDDIGVWAICSYGLLCNALWHCCTQSQCTASITTGPTWHYDLVGLIEPRSWGAKSAKFWLQISFDFSWPGSLSLQEFSSTPGTFFQKILVLLFR